MKKLLSVLLSAALLSAPVSALAEDEVRVYLDNRRVAFDQPPIIMDGRTMVPVRAVFEQAGADVSWNQDTTTATIIYESNVVTIRPGDEFLYANGKAIKLDVPAMIENDRILIPLRAISEAIDFKVTWNGATMSVLIATEGEAYRPYTSLYTGMKDIRDYADFYGDYSFDGLSMDVNGDGNADTLAFTQTLDTTVAPAPLLRINNIDYSSVVKDLKNLRAIAVVDIDIEDGEKELVLISGGEYLQANILRYQGGNLTRLENQVDFNEKLFFDGKQNFISDMGGLTFTDIMSTGAIYVYEGGMVKTYQANTKHVIRNATHAYDDECVFWITKTNDYKKGTYRESHGETIKADDLQSFKVLDIYIDPSAPEYTEFYIELPDGTRAVLTPYRV